MPEPIKFTVIEKDNDTLIKFRDGMENTGIIRTCSLLNEPTIAFGRSFEAIYLTQQHVLQLLPILTAFAYSGQIPNQKQYEELNNESTPT